MFWLSNKNISFSIRNLNLSPGSNRMKHVLSELCYKGTILQRNRSFSSNSFVKVHGKALGATT